MSRWVGALIACSAVLVACGQQTATTASAENGFGVATAMPPSSGLMDYNSSKHSGWDGRKDWDRKGDRDGKKDWDRKGDWDGKNDWGRKGDWGHKGGWGGGPGGWGGYAPWGGGYGGYGGGYGDFWGYGNPWGWPYYVPPIYVSSSFGNPFAPPPAAAGPWINPFYGYLGYVGI